MVHAKSVDAGPRTERGVLEGNRARKVARVWEGSDPSPRVPTPPPPPTNSDCVDRGCNRGESSQTLRMFTVKHLFSLCPKTEALFFSSSRACEGCHFLSSFAEEGLRRVDVSPRCCAPAGGTTTPRIANWDICASLCEEQMLCIKPPGVFPRRSEGLEKRQFHISVSRTKLFLSGCLPNMVSIFPGTRVQLVLGSQKSVNT